MTPFLSFVNFSAGVETLVLLLLSALLLSSFVIKDLSFIRAWFVKNVFVLGTLVAGIGVLGSLFYSEIAGYEPCVLCWWARIFIYPMAILFAVAWRRRDINVFHTTRILAGIGLLFSLYHNYLSWGGTDVGVCDNVSLCTKLYVNEFGFVTIPLMGFATLLFLLLISVSPMRRREYN